MDPKCVFFKDNFTSLKKKQDCIDDRGTGAHYENMVIYGEYQATHLPSCPQQDTRTAGTDWINCQHHSTNPYVFLMY